MALGAALTAEAGAKTALTEPARTRKFGSYREQGHERASQPLAARADWGERDVFMAQLAAGQPFYESTWLAAASILPLLIILGAVLLLILMAACHAWRYARSRPLIAWGVAVIAIATALALPGLLRSAHFVTLGLVPSVQDLLQQRLTQDEQALDEGVLTYPALPAVKAGLPFMMSASMIQGVGGLG
jgi:hypothetical protein